HDGSFAVFADHFARGPLSLQALPGRSAPGASVRRTAGPAASPTAAAVYSPHGVRVVRSVAAAAGWSATRHPRRGPAAPPAGPPAWRPAGPVWSRPSTSRREAALSPGVTSRRGSRPASRCPSGRPRSSFSWWPAQPASGFFALRPRAAPGVPGIGPRRARGRSAGTLSGPGQADDGGEPERAGRREGDEDG